jgi:hypothetical protein
MRWLHRLSALMRREAEVAIDEDASNGPESEIRRRVMSMGEVAIREVVPHAGEQRLKARRALETLYFEQRCVLEERFKQQAVDVLVADYALAAPWDAPPFSYCVWMRGALALLPETDFVVLSAMETKTSGYWEAIVPWIELLRVTGDACFVLEPDLIPVRWKAEMWPTRPMLQELKAARVRFSRNSVRARAL